MEKKQIERKKEIVEIIRELIILDHKLVVEATSDYEQGLRAEPGIRDKGGIETLAFKIANVLIKNPADIFPHAARIFIEMARTYHNFFDGNKRTSYLTVKSILRIKGYNFKVDYYKEAVPFILDIASGKKTEKEVEKWLRENSKRISKEERKKYLMDAAGDVKK